VGLGDFCPWKIFKIEVLGGGMAGILRPSQCVIMSFFIFFIFNLGGSAESPEQPPKSVPA